MYEGEYYVSREIVVNIQVSIYNSTFPLNHPNIVSQNKTNRYIIQHLWLNWFVLLLLITLTEFEYSYSE